MRNLRGPGAEAAADSFHTTPLSCIFILHKAHPHNLIFQRPDDPARFRDSEAQHRLGGVPVLFSAPRPRLGSIKIFFCSTSQQTRASFAVCFPVRSFLFWFRSGSLFLCCFFTVQRPKLGFFIGQTTKSGTYLNNSASPCGTDKHIYIFFTRSATLIGQFSLVPFFDTNSLRYIVLRLFSSAVTVF